MPPYTRTRRRALALVVAAGLFATPHLSAQSPSGLEDATVTDFTAQPDGTIRLTANEYFGYQDAQSAIPAPPSPIADDSPIAEQPAVDAVEAAQEPVPMADAGAMAAPVMPSCNCCNTACCTKKQKEAATAAMKGAYKGVFYANDFSYLNDPCYDGPSFIGDNLKGMLNGNLDVGGEARVRYHKENNFRGLGLTGRDDSFFLTRLRLFANMQLGEYFRVYGEYLYADSAGEFFNNRPIEENRGEIQNLFLDTRLTDDFVLRVGRQELLFADQRLISPLDWANTRRSFQGVRGTYQGDCWTVDGFFVNPLNRNAANESKIDDANEDVRFFGLYASNPNTRWGTLDGYYLGLINRALGFEYHTLGKRLVGQWDNGVMYATEGGFQFGKNSPGFGDHSAGFFTGGLGKQLSICTSCGEWKPTVWAWYDYASGGDDVPAARGDDGFDHLFPLAHKYNGFMDLFGRRNLHDINFQFITPILGTKVKMLAWYHLFYLAEDTTPYNVTMSPFNPNFAAGDRELGQEIDLAFTATINPRTNVVVGYSHFNSGDYYKTTQGVPTDADADFFWTQFQWRF